MIFHRWFVLPLLCLFLGCKSHEAKVLDFAGIIFLIFSVLVITTLYFEKVLSTPFAKKVIIFFAPVRRFIPTIPLVLGLFICLFGILGSGLTKIAIFIGIITILFGWFCKQYNREDIDDKMRVRYAKVMVVCLTFAFTLFILFTSVHQKLKL